MRACIPETFLQISKIENEIYYPPIVALEHMSLSNSEHDWYGHLLFNRFV